MGIDPDLATAVARSLDGLLAALRLQEMDDGRFVVSSEPTQFGDRIYGGQLLAQALLAAATTADGKEPSALHATFVSVGAPGQPIEVRVDRVRDGGSTASRLATVTQDGRTLLNAIATFHRNGPGPEAFSPPPAGPAPEQLPLLQEWVARLPDEHRDRQRSWVEQPPPLEIRMGEPPTFLGGPSGVGMRSHWMRAPRDLGDDPALNAAILAYASDFFLMDMVFRFHPDGSGVGRWSGFSLDHALWIYRPVRFDRWHLHTQEAIAVVGQRGLARGAMHDDQGRLVATVVQEISLRPMGSG